MYKKGQVEDIFADLIPSIVIIVIAVFILENFSSEHEDSISEKLMELESSLKVKADIKDYIRIPIPSDLKDEECANPRFTVADIIINIDPEDKDDPCLDLLNEITSRFKKEIVGEMESIDVYLKFPNKLINLKMSEEVDSRDEQTVFVPLRSGEHVDVKLIIGPIDIMKEPSS